LAPQSEIAIRRAAEALLCHAGRGRGGRDRVGRHDRVWRNEEAHPVEGCVDHFERGDEPAARFAGLEAHEDPKSCLIAVTAELLEHPLAHAARVLRQEGATPAQVKVGIQLALGKTKAKIANELGIQLNSVASLTQQLYQTLGVHNAAGLGARIWLPQR
jgi:DNA-binding CsgD family transcriptional regulator